MYRILTHLAKVHVLQIFPELEVGLLELLVHQGVQVLGGVVALELRGQSPVCLRVGALGFELHPQLLRLTVLARLFFGALAGFEVSPRGITSWQLMVPLGQSQRCTRTSGVG